MCSQNAYQSRISILVVIKVGNIIVLFDHRSDVGKLRGNFAYGDGEQNVRNLNMPKIQSLHSKFRR